MDYSRYRGRSPTAALLDDLAPCWWCFLRRPSVTTRTSPTPIRTRFLALHLHAQPTNRRDPSRLGSSAIARNVVATTADVGEAPLPPKSLLTEQRPPSDSRNCRRELRGRARDRLRAPAESTTRARQLLKFMIVPSERPRHASAHARSTQSARPSAYLALKATFRKYDLAWCPGSIHVALVTLVDSSAPVPADLALAPRLTLFLGCGSVVGLSW